METVTTIKVPEKFPSCYPKSKKNPKSFNEYPCSQRLTAGYEIFFPGPHIYSKLYRADYKLNDE